MKHFLPLAAVFIAMLALTWQRWTDPLVDFGRELYVPWQVSQGKVLYRDIAHFTGPLSVYFNATMFRVLGTSARTIEIANTAIAAAVVVMVWKLARRAPRSQLAAHVACILFITLFMPIQLVDIGNYNWITPYSHELTHGVALSLAALLVMSSQLARPRVWRAALLGLLLGLVLLTKVEVSLAIVPAIIVALILSRRRAHWPLLITGLVVPLAIALLLLGKDAVIAPWSYALDRRLASLPFYRRSMGTDRPLANLGGAIVTPLKLFIPSNLGDWLTNWSRAFNGLIFVTLALTAAAFVRARRHRPRAVLRFAIALFASILLAKIALNVRIQHYGFALAMPAMLATFAALVASRRTVIHAIGLCVVALIIGVHLYVYTVRFRPKHVTIAEGTADQLRVDDRGLLVNELARTLRDLPQGATVALIPQGAIVNYLGDHPNSTPFITLMPPEIIMFGDERMTRAYEMNPPDVIVLIDTDLSEYGFKSFDEVAPRWMTWMRANYEVAQVLQSPAPDLPSARIMRRR